jgi:hypothetical protein
MNVSVNGEITAQIVMTKIKEMPFRESLPRAAQGVVGNVRVAPQASKAMRPACLLDKRNGRFEALMNHFRWQRSLRLLFLPQ